MTRLDDGIPVETVDVVEGLEGCHSANISPDNRTLWVPALKQDRICLFTLSDDGHRWRRILLKSPPLRAQVLAIWYSTRTSSMPTSLTN